MNNYERLRVALDLLRDELEIFVSSRLVDQFGLERYRSLYAFSDGRDGQQNIDVQVLVNTIINNWDVAFQAHMSDDSRHFVHQVRKSRNRLAHQEQFDDSDTYTSLHEIQRLLESIHSTRASEIEITKASLLQGMALGSASAETAARLESEADIVGSHQARLTLLVSGRVTTMQFLFELPVIIGRAPEPGEGSIVDLTDIDGGTYISRRHARITYEPDGYYLEDLSSSNGTYVLKGEFERVEKIKINNGDQIAFGNARFLFETVVLDKQDIS